MRTKTVYVRDKARLRLSSFPNFSATGNIRGMTLPPSMDTPTEAPKNTRPPTRFSSKGRICKGE